MTSIPLLSGRNLVSPKSKFTFQEMKKGFFENILLSYLLQKKSEKITSWLFPFISVVWHLIEDEVWGSNGVTRFCHKLFLMPVIG